MKFLIKQFPATPCQFPTHSQTFSLAHYSQGQVSTVHVVTCYGLDGPWFDPPWGQEVFASAKPVQTGPGAHPASSNGWGYSSQHMAQTTHSHPAAGLRQSTAVPLPPFCAFISCHTESFTFLPYFPTPSVCACPLGDELSITAEQHVQCQSTC
jgi:hypothetical protein